MKKNITIPEIVQSFFGGDLDQLNKRVAELTLERKTGTRNYFYSNLETYRSEYEIVQTMTHLGFNNLEVAEMVGAWQKETRRV
jgi:hypothetical protein